MEDFSVNNKQSGFEGKKPDKKSKCYFDKVFNKPNEIQTKNSQIDSLKKNNILSNYTMEQCTDNINISRGQSGKFICLQKYNYDSENDLRPINLHELKIR